MCRGGGYPLDGVTARLDKEVTKWQNGRKHPVFFSYYLCQAENNFMQEIVKLWFMNALV